MTTRVSALAFVVVSLVAASSRAEQVRLHGATTVIDVVVNPHKAAVEKSTGHTLELAGNATGKGLADLVEGKADIALCSEPVDIAVAAAKVAGKEVDASKLQFTVVKKAQVMFIVHPSNPVTSLTWQQISDVLTGKITNWKDLGGPDKPITVYSDTITGGTRALIKKSVMKGAEYGKAVKALTAVKKVGELVAVDPLGFGGLGAGFVDSNTVKVVKTDTLERPLGFITLGPPTGKALQVIEAFKTAVASAK
ncbi:MAG: substrate-binding domain-containing protein [Myxococcales bacterium]